MVQILRKWLNVPLPQPLPTQDLAALRDRMDSLERLVMAELQQPSLPQIVDNSIDEGRLQDSPDAHLGAQ
tara:strand:+ start:1079 stop:1288 length:210 start_codon:yes stop_codon:yes gene_type:complete